METVEREIKAGFFSMDIIKEVCKQSDVAVAKQIALDVVESKKDEAKAESVRKATVVINKAKTVKDLGLTLTNWMFAHPSENLKVIR